jgi:hypothetical protein
MNPLPFNVPNEYLIQLKGKQPAYSGWGKNKLFKPFEHNTGIACMYYPEYEAYLFVLDFDYPDKWNNPVYQSFKYNDTYTRETKNGLHLFYWSPTPSSIIQNKNHLDVDLRRTSLVGALNNRKGNFVVYYDLPDNGLPVKRIDSNIVVEELYRSNGTTIRYQKENDSYKYNPEGNYKIGGNYKIDYYQMLIASILKRYHSDWSHAYDISFKWGLKLRPIIKSEKDMVRIAIQLMNITPYPHKENWVINLMNGWKLSENQSVWSFLGSYKNTMEAIQDKVHFDFYQFDLNNREVTKKDVEYMFQIPLIWVVQFMKSRRNELKQLYGED